MDRPQVRANGEDLAYATVELLDAAGTSVYALSGDRDVRVKVSGAGALAGIGNGDPVDASSFQSGKRKTFHGRVVATVRAGTDAGPIFIEIEPDGLAARRVQVNVVASHVSSTDRGRQLSRVRAVRPPRSIRPM